jgi:hypothetical protein
MSDLIQYGKLYCLKTGGMYYTVSKGDNPDKVWAQCASHGLKLQFTIVDFLSKFVIVNPDPAPLPKVVAPVVPPVPDIPPKALNVTDTPPGGS